VDKYVHRYLAMALELNCGKGLTGITVRKKQKTILISINYSALLRRSYKIAVFGG
jgi:hypothetical protein